MTPVEEYLFVAERRALQEAQRTAPAVEAMAIVHDEEVRFKARARRNKLLGLWAAQKLGLAGDAAEAYAKEIVFADFEGPGDDDMFARIRRDFDVKAVAQSDHQIRRTMEELMAKVVEDVKAGR
jgi:hypothetical protein